MFTIEVSARFISLTIFACLFSHVLCENVNLNFTSSPIDLDSKSEVVEDVDGWARLAQEVVVSSQPVQLRKRSDSDSETTMEPPKKKPVMYSWWMPNMDMGGQQTKPVTTPSPVDEPEPTEMTTTKPTTTKKTRPTRKPRPSLRPKTRKPSSASTPTPTVDHTESSIPQTTNPPPASKTTLTPSPAKIKTTSKASTITTEAPSSYIDEALRIKKKLLNIAKVVGGVALIAKGTTGQLALSTTGVDPYVEAAGKVGSFAVKAAPVAKMVAIQAGSLAASALSKAGNLTVAGAGRAYEAISTRYAQRAQARDDYEKANSNSEKHMTMRDIPIIVMNTRAIKTSPHPQLHNVEQKTKSTDMNVEMTVVGKSKDTGDAEHANKSKSKPEPKATEPASEMVETQDVPKMRMTTGRDKDSRRFRYETDEKSFGTYNKAGLFLICTTLGLQLFISNLY